MERLTEKERAWQEDLYWCDYLNPSAQAIDDVYSRLADIEDILGDNYDLDRLRELVNADRDGRCVVLQYKKNDVAYSIKHYPFIRKVVVRQMLVDTDNGVVWYHCIDDLWNPDFFVSCDIGKTVFRTREEAEVALKARKRVENDV